MKEPNKDLILRRIARCLVGIYEDELSTPEAKIANVLVEQGYLRWSKNDKPARTLVSVGKTK